MKIYRPLLLIGLLGISALSCGEKPAPDRAVSPEVMEEIYQEIRTPYKYGVVYKHPDPEKKSG